MLLRLLLIVVAVLGLSLGGCKKKEPTLQDMQKEAQKQAEETKDATEDAKEAAGDMAEEMQK